MPGHKWKKAGNSKKAEPGKRVYQAPVSEIAGVYGLDPFLSECDDVLSLTASALGNSLGGSVKRYSRGINGKGVEGYCLIDEVDPNRTGPVIPKVYASSDKVSVVIPPKMDLKRLSEATRVKKWKRLV